MPYVFDRLSKLMGEGNTNIFQPGQEQGGAQRRQGFKLTGDGGGEAAGGQAQVKDTGGAQPSMALTSGASQQEIASKNQPVGGTSNVLGGVSQALQSQEQKLQSEADKYGQTAEQQASSLVGFQGPKSQKTTKQRVAEALESGQTEGIKKALSGEKKDIDAFQTSVTPESIQVPKSRDELASYLQGEKGGAYTKGMSRLDAALLGKSQDFQRQQQELAAKKEALQAKRNEAMKLTGQEQKELSDQAALESAEIRRALESLGQETLLTGKKGQTDIKNKMLAGPSAEQKKAAFEAAVKAAGLSDVNQAELMSAVDPSQFYKSSYNPEVDSENLLNYLGDPEYERYSQIMSLLGQAPGERRQVGFSGSFDEKALQDALSKAGSGIREKTRAKEIAALPAAAARAEEQKSPVQSERSVPELITESKKQKPKNLFEKTVGAITKGAKKNLVRIPGRSI